MHRAIQIRQLADVDILDCMVAGFGSGKPLGLRIAES
jgi:hypothetical protein